MESTDQAQLERRFKEYSLQLIEYEQEFGLAVVQNSTRQLHRAMAFVPIRFSAGSVGIGVLVAVLTTMVVSVMRGSDLTEHVYATVFAILFLVGLQWGIHRMSLYWFRKHIRSLAEHLFDKHGQPQPHQIARVRAVSRWFEPVGVMEDEEMQVVMVFSPTAPHILFLRDRLFEQGR